MSEAEQRLAEENPGTVVLRWVMVAEVMDENGKRSLARTWSDSCERWDRELLLSTGLDEDYWDEDDAENP